MCDSLFASVYTGFFSFLFFNGPASDSSSTDFKKTPWNSLDDTRRRLWTQVINQAAISMLG